MRSGRHSFKHTKEELSILDSGAWAKGWQCEGMMLRNLEVVRMVEAHCGVEIIGESELQISKGKMWKGLECHDNTRFLV